MIKPLCVALSLLIATTASATLPPADMTALGVDVDFYTGPISSDVWLQMKQSGQTFAIAQAWGGRSRNEFAVSQLEGARKIAGMKTAAYILLNYDDKVCPTYAKPVRDRNGRCSGQLVPQKKSGARWQVQQGLAALGAELANASFIALDVEWFLSAPPPSDAGSLARRRQAIMDALDEIRDNQKRPVIYTRNARRHWREITGCDMASTEAGCAALHDVINNPAEPIPLWDVQHGDASLDDFQPHGAWSDRVGRQYRLDANLFGLPGGRTVDLNVFDASVFLTSR